MNTVDIIVPCYNEAAGLDLFYLRTMESIEGLQNRVYEFLFSFVNDGSKDDTLQVMMHLAQQHPPELIPKMAASLEAGHDFCAAPSTC